MAGGSVRYENVTKRYATADALVDFDLDISAGEFMVFLGPSGSGKTTALNVLAGFAEATSGDILIDGKSVSRLPPEERNLGMVFQSYSLFPHMTVFDNIAFPLKLRNFAKADITRKVEQYLDMVRLSDLAGRMPKELSGGQRQRVAFARAVVFEPPVLLMDEPLGALDLKLRQAMQIEMKRYHQQLGCTVVFVTHDQGEALALSDRVAVMGNGRIVQVDTPDRIYDQPTSRYVAEFIGRTNILKLERLGGGAYRIVDLDQTFPAKDRQVSGSGDATALSLRPERLRRSTAAGTGEIRIPACVEETLFLGDIVQYSVLTPTGLRLLFEEHRSTNHAVLSRGEPIVLEFDSRDALPLSD
jgi:putative spermidine/putrescine transport system ATP-binding protein